MAQAILDTFKQVASEHSFQKLPIQAQVFYFHMLARADEDGRVPLPYEIYFMLEEIHDFFKFPPEAIRCLKEADFIAVTEDDVVYISHVNKMKQ